MGAERTAVVSVDVDYRSNPFQRLWLDGFLDCLTSCGFTVVFIPSYVEAEVVHEHISRKGIKLGDIPNRSAEMLNDGHITPRFQARNIVRQARKDPNAQVFVQGFDLSLAVGRTNEFQDRLWALIDDDPYTPRSLSQKELELLKLTAVGSKLLLTADEGVRAQIDSGCIEATSKTRTLPWLGASFEPAEESPSKARRNRIALDLHSDFEVLKALQLTDYAEYQRGQVEPQPFSIYGAGNSESDEFAAALEDSGLSNYPFLDIHNESIVQSGKAHSADVIFVPNFKAHAETSYHHRLLHAVSLPFITSNIPDLECAIQQKPLQIQNRELDFKTLINSELADYQLVPSAAKKIRVVLAGADFKFAGDLIDLLIQREDIELRIDRFETNARPQPRVSKPFLDWADIIIAEFSAYNAIWYSQNVRKDQRLIVHLHGYELLQDWITELNMDNVYSVVFASQFYRDKAIELRSWPREKLTVIPNSVRTLDLKRPKTNNAVYHIALVGYVPILKRPDRALDLLELLLGEDDSFILHLKGHFPWNYPWEWQKLAHQDSYRLFFDRIQKSEALRNHIMFEDFSPDIGNWLRGIGWVLSTSTRETFHLAPIEGAASGAIPVVWDRAGAKEIMGEHHVVFSTEEAAQKILSASRSNDDYHSLVHQALETANKYSFESVRGLWINHIQVAFSEILLLSNQDKKGYLKKLANADVQLFEAVQNELEGGSCENALEILNRNINHTKTAVGLLKELEYFVRGINELDKARYSLAAPTSSKLPANGIRPLIALPTNINDNEPGMPRLDGDLVQVSPPQYLIGAGRLPDNENYISGTIVKPMLNIRFDRWVQFVKAVLQRSAMLFEANSLIVKGSWWLALPAKRAADELEIPLIWYHTLNSKSYSSDFDYPAPIHKTVKAEIGKNHGVILEGDDTNVKDGLDPVRFSILNHSELQEAVVNSPSFLKSNFLKHEKTYLVDDLSQLCIAVIASGFDTSPLEQYLKKVIQIQPEDSLDFIRRDIDAVLVLGPSQSQIDGKLSLRKESRKVVQSFDAWRRYGTPSVFVDLRSHDVPLPSEIVGIARRCDSVFSKFDSFLERLLRLDPSSIRSAGPLMDNTIPLWQLELLLRSVNIWVERADRRTLDADSNCDRTLQDQGCNDS